MQEENGPRGLSETEMHCLERLHVPAFHYVLQLLLGHFGHALHQVSAAAAEVAHTKLCQQKEAVNGSCYFQSF